MYEFLLRRRRNVVHSILRSMCRRYRILSRYSSSRSNDSGNRNPLSSTSLRVASYSINARSNSRRAISIIRSRGKTIPAPIFQRMCVVGRYNSCRHNKKIFNFLLFFIVSWFLFFRLLLRYTCMLRIFLRGGYFIKRNF